MKRVLMTVTLVAAAAVAACGYSSGGGPGIGFTISPPDGSIDQALDVTVAVNFDNDITEPPDWMDSFTLKETEDGPTICDDVVYNAAGKRATCEHAELTPNTNYLVVVTDITAVNGQQTNFTTED